MTTLAEYVVGADLVVRIDEGVFTLPSLAGEDVHRRPGEVCVTIDGGRLHDAKTGNALCLTAPHTLLGWGSLNGPAVSVGPAGGPTVSVPVCVIEHLERHHGLRMQREQMDAGQ